MAGNKGRGHASFTFNIEAIGFARGEKLPDVVLKPPPLYPDTDYKPVPLKADEAEEYMLALKQEFRATMKNSPTIIEHRLNLPQLLFLSLCLHPPKSSFPIQHIRTCTESGQGPFFIQSCILIEYSPITI
uniref:RNA polymerase III subunit G n=1 Tax=Sarcophilus harrisii TaxID=9305 RepID=A0A7N4PBV1_SARHA